MALLMDEVRRTEMERNSPMMRMPTEIDDGKGGEWRVTRRSLGDGPEVIVLQWDQSATSAAAEQNQLQRCEQRYAVLQQREYGLRLQISALSQSEVEEQGRLRNELANAVTEMAGLKITLEKHYHFSPAVDAKGNPIPDKLNAGKQAIRMVRKDRSAGRVKEYVFPLDLAGWVLVVEEATS